MPWRISARVARLAREERTAATRSRIRIFTAIAARLGPGAARPTYDRPAVPDRDADELTTLWRRVRDDLAASVPGPTFKLWLAPLRAVSAQGSTLYLTAPPTVRNWVERRYMHRLDEALARCAQDLDSIAFVTNNDPERRRAGSVGEEAPRSLPLDRAHTFDRFVIGPGNRLAHAAALAVAELPGDAYNPLFLYGPPGLGKTHLLGAIAAYLQENHPQLSVHHTTAERFTTEFVAALRHHGPERFKARYRNLDALLIDDVQVLEGKERTEEEFVHTFNALHAAGKQIVLSSDRPPQSLSRLEARLRDRFEWGLSASIEPPDLRTRVAVLWRIASRASVELPEPGVLQDIAAQVPANVRLLEGAMTRVLALASVLDQPLAPAVVEHALRRTDPATPADSPSIEAIQAAVCSTVSVSPRDLLSASRSPRIARARQLAMYTARELTSHSLTEIASAFNRDHTTVLHAIRSVDQRLTPGSETSIALHKVRSTLGDSRRSSQPRRTPGST
jgi:chromosomal replication initiator protein